MHPKTPATRPHHQLPASALYSHPSLGRLWKKVHLACSPFLKRAAIRRLYQRPASILRRILSGPYSLVALGCAEGAKEFLLLQRLPKPAFLLAADTNLSLARRATHRLPGTRKVACRIDLTTHLPSSIPRCPRPRLFTLFGVLPNLDPLPLLRRLTRAMQKEDVLLFSANLAPGKSGFAGTRRVLPQYHNPPTRRWLEAAVRRSRPRLPSGRIEFGVYPDPGQKSLARIEARWITRRKSWIIFSSRRPTARQVELWISRARLKKIARFLDPRGEEGVWLVGHTPS